MTGLDQRAQAAALVRNGELEEAERMARQILREQPGDPEALGTLCQSLTGQMEFAQALPIAQQVVDNTSLGFPQRHAMLRELLVCAAQLGLIELGREYIERHAPNYEPLSSSERAWVGIFFMTLGLCDEALASYREALLSFPDDDYLVHQQGVAELSLGRPEGMQNYRRYMIRSFWKRYYTHIQDVSGMWEGEPIDGKSMLVVMHGGVGDFIQFIRYARVLKEQGAREVVVVPPNERIRGFLASCEDVRIGALSDISSVDCWAPVFGLCTHLFETHGALSVERYLRAPSSPAAHAQLGLIRRRAAGRRCIAIAWHSDMLDGSVRSVPLGTLLPLFGLPNIHWVITQRGVGLRQFMRSGLDSQCSVIGEDSTFDDTSALMAGLDGVVTIDSYSLHMAGALGVPTWFLAGRVLDWRHLNEETRSIWYPSVRIVRQPTIGDWRSAVEDLRQQLAAL